jgi:DNA polymerase elongation subunit (family B)
LSQREFVVTKGKGRIRDKVKLAEDAKQDDYDPEYYTNNQVIPSVERIFYALGYTKDDLKDHAGQKKLGSFM